MSSTFPEDPEAWSESLTPAEGYWEAMYSNNSVHLDRVYKQSGDACIAVSYDSSRGACAVGAIFRFHSPHDLRGFKSINFLNLLQAAVNGVPAFTGECLIVIGTGTGLGYIYKPYGTAPGAYDPKSWDLRKDFDLGAGAKSVEEVLSAVTFLYIKCMVNRCDGPFGQRCFIDRPYFARELGTLYVKSEPSGKTFTFDGHGFVTPHGFKGAVGDEHTIVMSDGEFIEWEDGSTSRTRVVTIPEGSGIITAYYKGAPPSKPREIPIEMVIGFGAVFTAAVVLALLGGRGLRR